MKLTHSQSSEIISNYTSSIEVFITLQSLIMNSLMYHERRNRCTSVSFLLSVVVIKLKKIQKV